MKTGTSAPVTSPQVATTAFSINPDPSLLYLTASLRAALHKCRFVIENYQGLTAIEGDVGLGKSTILRYLYHSYSSRDDCRTAFIHTPNFKSDFAFLKAICAELALPIRISMQKQESELNSYLIGEYRENRKVILFLDEAQKMPGVQLELLRTLLNFETGQHKLIQIVIAAQLELRQKLADPSKKALRSRIFAPSSLTALTPDETQAMIDFRCQQAGIDNPFTPEAVQSIYILTGGIPREILKTCAIGMELMKEAGLNEVTADMAAMIHGEAVYE
jgi:type II secretory pathway predicted ATPase ExeA